MRAAVPLVAVLLAGAPACTRSRSLDERLAAGLFDRVRLDTGGAHGLSGLTVDTAGGLWTVAERAGVALRIELDGTTVRSISRHPLVGVLAGEDLEAVAAVGGDLVVGTEGHDRGLVRIYRLSRDGVRLRAGPPRRFTSDQLGVEIGANHGAEGACAAGGRLAIAVETAGVDPRGRWAPLAVIDAGALDRDPPRLVRVRLGTTTGKLSAITCWAEGDRVRALAIERHFEVTRLIAFDLPDGPGEVTPVVALDLAPVLRGSLNLEGLTRLPDGRFVAVVDNQYGRITGPDELLVFHPGAIVLPP